MWARSIGGVLEVVAVTDRGDVVTSNPSADGAVAPMFDRDYLAPETETSTADERSLVFTLAAITAEWLTGRYPFASTWWLHSDGPRMGRPLPLDLPSQLASILVRALSRDPAARPTLPSFIDDLATCV
jgi:serine/threonine protein kinase